MTLDGDPEAQGRQLERLTFFSDAVFAIAITLLVIEVRVPELHRASDQDLGQALVNLLPNYIGFVSSFLVIGRFWFSHHELFGMLKAASNRLIWANMFLLLVIAFMPFPTAVFSEYVQLRVGVGFYAVWLTVIGLMNARVARVALRTPELVREHVDPETIRVKLRGSWTAVMIGVTAFVAGMVHPLASLPALAIASPLFSVLFNRRRKTAVTPG